MKGRITGILIITGILATVQGLTEDLTVVQEEKGIVLTGIGVLAEDANPMFISTFLKIKNPSIEDNACLGICDLNQGEILTKLALERCDQMDDKTGNGDKMIEKIEFDGEIGNDTVVVQCFQECLKNGECSEFGIRPQKGADKLDCILRRGAPKGKKTWKGAKEYDLECMIGDKQQFCKDRISDTNKLINRENAKYVNSTMEGFQSMISAVGSKSRVKRYVAPVLGGLGMITSGFALFETYQLQQHYI